MGKETRSEFRNSKISPPPCSKISKHLKILGEREKSQTSGLSDGKMGWDIVTRFWPLVASLNLLALNQLHTKGEDDKVTVLLHWVECPMFMVERRVIKFVAWITRGSAQQATLFFHPKKEPRRPRLRAQRKDLRLARVIFHGFVIRGVRFIFFIPTSELCKAFFTAREKIWPFVKKCVEWSSKRICELSQLLSDS